MPAGRVVLRALALATVTLALSSCTDRGARGDSQTSSPVEAGVRFETDDWLGQWNGPEGTFLRLEGGQGTYDITIQDLDGPRRYTGFVTDRTA